MLRRTLLILALLALAVATAGCELVDVLGKSSRAPDGDTTAGETSAEPGSSSNSGDDTSDDDDDDDDDASGWDEEDD
jgi:hypothetical protein